MYPIITISREMASGGHRIGEQVARQLDLPFIDRDFIRNVAKETGLDVREIEKQGEAGSYLEKYFSGSYYNGLYLGDDQDRIFTAQKKIILEYAHQGPCVIVGRCADYILTQNHIPCLKVFIHAEPEIRKDNYVKMYGQPEHSVDKILAKNDKGRRFYYRYYTEQEMGAYQNYDLNLDSGTLGEALCVELITKAAEAMNRK